MAAITTGNGLGLFNTSVNLLGASSPHQDPTLGKPGQGDRITVNAATGNLVIQQTDEILANSGLDLNLVRTYNSQGQWDGDNNDNWQLSPYQKLLVTGNVNIIGSYVDRTTADGAQIRYTYVNPTSGNYGAGSYVSTDGDGAHDLLTFNTGTQIWTFVDGSTRATETCDYDALTRTGRLLSTKDIDGNTTTYNYDGATGRLTQIQTLTQDASGTNTFLNQTTYLDYTDAAHPNNLTQLRTVSNGGEQVRTQYKYDTANRLSQVLVDLTPTDALQTADVNSDGILEGINGQSYVTTYTYDGASKRVASITQGDGTTVSFTYDTSNRLKTIVDGKEGVTTFNYISATQTDVVDALNRTTSYTYDANKRLTQLESPTVGGTRLTTQYTYDTKGNLTSITDARNNVTTLRYDAAGNLIFTYDALGNSVTRTYNTTNQLTTETRFVNRDYDGAGPGAASGPLTTRYVYDNDNHLRFIVSPDGRVTEYRYNPVGQRISEIQYTGSPYNLGTLKNRPISLDFDGVNNAVTYTNPNLGTGPLTIQAWINADTLVGGDDSYGGRGILRSTTGDKKGDYYLSVDTQGRVHFAYWNIDGNDTTGRVFVDSSNAANKLITPGQWYHIAATVSFDAGGNAIRKIYINGVEQTLGTPAWTDIYWGTEHAIGRSYPGSPYSFDGQIDDVRLYTGALTQPEINGLYGNDNYSTPNGTLQARWAFDQTSGTTAVNSVNTTLNGTLTGGMTGNEWRVGIPTGLTEDDLNAWVSGLANKTKALRTDYAYDFRGLLSTATTYDTINSSGDGVADGTQSVTRYVYDQRGYLLQTIDPRGEATTTDPNDYVTHYTYDGLGRLLTTTQWVSSTETRTTTSVFDDTNNQIRTTAANGLLTTRVYDKTGNLVTEHTMDPVLWGQDFSQDASGLTGEGITGPNYMTLENGRLALNNQSAGTTTTFPDAVGERVYAFEDKVVFRFEVTLGNTSTGRDVVFGIENTQTRNTPAYRRHAVRFENGFIKMNAFDGVWWDQIGLDLAKNGASYIVEVVTDTTNTTLYIYEKGQQRQDGYSHTLSTTGWGDMRTFMVVRVAPGWPSNTTYVDNLSESLTLGTLNTYRYDANGRLRITTDPTGLKTHYIYDEAGRRVGEVDGTGALTEYVYNKNSQVAQTIRYYDAVTSTALTNLNALDAQGNAANVALSTVRPTTNGTLNRVTYYVYDTVNRLVWTVYPHDTDPNLGYATQTGYDGAHRVTETLRYNTAVSVTALATNPDSAASAVNPPTDTANDRRTRYFYDSSGNRIGSLDALGYLTENQYNAAGQLIHTIGYAKATTSATRATDGFFGTKNNIVNQGASPDDQHTYLFYNAKGQVIATLDAENYLTEYQYDAAGNQTVETRYDTQSPAYTNQTVAQLRPAGSPTDRVVLTEYNGANQVVSVTTNPFGTQTTYEYNALGQLTHTHAALNTAEVRTTQARYDVKGNLTGELTGEGSVALAALGANPGQSAIDNVWATYGLTHAYDAANRRISTTDQNNHQTLFYYDHANRLTYTVNGLGEVSHTVYNSLGQVSDTTRYSGRLNSTDLSALTGGLETPDVVNKVNAIANPGGPNPDNHNHYNHNLRGMVREAIDALNKTTTYTYNAFGELKTSDAPISTTQSLLHDYSYDQRGLLTQTAWDPAGLNTQETRTYDAFGRLKTVKDANNHITEYTYDRLGRQVSVKDPLTFTRSVTYDAFGRTLTTTDALLRVTNYSYDDTNRRFTITTSEGVITTITTNRHGQTYQITDGNGNTTTYTYDMNGNLKTVTDALTNEITYNYDNANRKFETIDANGNVTQFAYDAANRLLTKIVDPGTGGLNLTTQYGYDGQGRTLTLTEAPNTTDSRATQYEYDAKGQLKASIVDPGVLNLRTEYTYDDAGHTLTVTEGANVPTESRTTQYVYDTLGRRIREIKDPTSVNPTGLNIVTEYVYDNTDNVLMKIEGQGTPEERITHYVYDANDRLTYVIDATGAVTENVYDKNGRVIETTRYANAIPVSTSLPDGITYNEVGYTYNSSTNQIVAGAGRSLTLGPDAYGDLTPSSVKIELYNGNGSLAASATTTVGNGNLSGYTNLWTPATNWAGQVNLPTVAAGTYQAVVTIRDNAYATESEAANHVGEGPQQYDNMDGTWVRTTSFTLNIDVGGAAVSTPYTLTEAELGQLLVVDSTQDQTTRYAYDRDGRQVFSIDAMGAVTQNIYDGNGNVIKQTKYATALNSTQLASLDAAAQTDRATTLQGFVTTLANASLDHSTRAVYDQANRLVYSIDAMGVVTENIYDNVGNIVQTLAYAIPIPGFNLPILDASPTRLATLQSMLSPSGEDRLTRAVYDAANRQIFSIDTLGYITETQYDLVGNVTDTIRYANPIPLQGNATYSNTVGYTYNSSTNQLVAGAGRSLTLGPDAYGDLTPSSVKIDLYNAAGNLAASSTTTVGQGNTGGYTNLWTPATNWAGQVNLPTAPAGTYQAVVTIRDDAYATETEAASHTGSGPQYYDNQDGTWARITALQITVDSAGNITSLVAAPNETEEEVRNVLISSINDQVTHRDYDKANRVTREINAEGGITATDYDDLGNIVKLTDANGNVGYFYYDRDGRATLEIDPEGYATEKVYDAHGNVVETIKYANQVQGAYNENTKPQILTSAPGGTPPPTYLVIDATKDRHTTYVYDRNDRLIETIEPPILAQTEAASVGGGLAVGPGGTFNFDFWQRNGAEANRYYLSMTVNFPPVGGYGPGNMKVVWNTYTDPGIRTWTIAGNTTGSITFNADPNPNDGQDLNNTYHYKADIYWVSPAGVQTWIAGVVKNNAWNSQQSPNHVYDAYSIPSRIRFTGQPAEAQTLRLSYWPLSDVNNITELDMAAEGTSGVFSTNVPGALLSGDYGYDAKAFDAQGEVLNHLTGTFSVVNGTTSTTVTGVPLQTGSLQIPHTYIAYDTFGNATANKDALGNYSYKVYDPLGRVKYEIDAERYLTEYSYDAFGNQKTLTRYAKALTEGLFSAKETASNAGNITGFNMDDVQNLLNVWTQDFSTDASGLTALPDPYFTLENGQLKVTSQSAATEGWPQVTGIPRAFDSGLLFHSEINTNSPSYGRVLLIGADNAWSNGVYRRHAAYFENGLLFASFYDPTNPDPWQKAPLSNAAKPLEDNTTYVVEVQTHEGGTTLYVYEKGADRATGWTHALSGASWHTDWNAAETFIQTYVGPGQPTSAVYVDNLSETYASIEDRTLTNTYDQLNQLIETKQQAVLVYDRATGLRPQSPTTQYQYDSNGNVVLTTDPNGNKTYSYYDKTGNKILQADPLGYVTAWEYDGNGNITRQSQYASALSAATRASLSVNSDSEALKTEVVNASNPDDRVVIYGYDRLNRKLQETLLDISFAGVNASTGALNEMNGSATTSYDYDGLGNLLYRTAPNGGFTSYSYDGLSRLTAETGQGYNDHLGAYVQGTMLTAYDGLGNVTTVTRQGNAAQGLADQVTQYFYDPQGNRTKEIDPEGNPVTYYYDLNGNITVKHTRRTNPDGTQPAVDTLYTYDKLNRQATTEDAKNFVYNATYNAFGEIVAKGLNDLDQEYYEYDQAGRLVKTNKDDGINRAYLYDASGNETANIQSADKDTNGNTNTTGIDLRPLTINQIAALSNTAVQRTESDYDARNQLTKTYQAPMEFISDAGGGVQEVWLNVLNNPYVGGSISSIGGTVNFAFHQYNSPRESNRYELLVDITWPPILGYGDGNIKIVWNTYTDPGTITRYAGPQDTGITINADATPNDNQALNNTYNYAIWVYKQTSYGDVLIASASRMNAWNNQQAPSYVYDSAQVPKQINFTGQSTSAQSMQLWIWPVNGTKPATPASVPMRTTSTGTPVTGHFIYDWSSLAPGNYKYEFKTFGAQGQLEYIRGEIALGSGSTATIKEQYTVQALPVSGTTFSNTIDRAQGYNAFGEIVSETDGRGYTTNFSYNKLGLLIKKEDPLTDATLENGAIVSLRPTTQYYYNKMGWTTGMRDANGNLSTQRYDSAGHLLADYQAVGTGELGKRLYAYDVFGNKRYMDNELLERTSYSYDDKNQLIRIDHPTDASFKDSNNNGNAARYELYDYDEAGRRIKHTRAWGVSASTNDDISELTYYDDIGRVKQVKSFGGITTSYRYIYDPIGGGSTVIATQGDGKTLTDTKDYFSRLLAHTDLGGHSFTYTYNKAGWLTHQQGDTNLAVAGLEQNIDFTYYHNGYLQEVVDHGVNTHARYEYDENGNRTFEGYYQETDGAVYYQWSKATYDQLNRVTQIDDAKYNLTYEYDANGNRRHVYARYHDGLQGNVQIQDYWYKYDAHNRFVVTKGTYSDTVINADGSHTWNRGSGTISAGTDGYAITYNVASQRTTANNESYIYTKDGLLAEVRIDGVLRAKRFYDAVGNVKDYYEYGTNGTTVTRQNHYTYTPDSQVNTENDGSITSTYYYDSAGTLLRVYSPQSGATINTLYAYEYWDSAKTKQIKISGTVTAYDPNLPWKPGFSDFTYDVNGHLTQVNDYGSDGVKNTGDDRYLNYKLDSNGLILQRNELIGNISSRTQRYYYLNGHGVGDAGGFGASHMDYVSLLASRDQEADKSGKPVSSADFDYNYQPINDQYPATTPGTYSVRAGDTLQSIAMAVWGDQSMWYLIADANGLSSNPTLIENQVLVIPNVVANIHNNASTFKVYNPGEIIGDTTPTLPDPPPPPPEDEKCGAFGQILPIIVQAVVTAFYGPIAGNIAGQLTGMATGVQDKFSWSSLATASIMPDIDFFPGIDNAVLNQAANAAVQNAATQGVAILFGEQEKFSWKAVAASAIAAPITSKIDQMLGTSPIKTGREFSWGQLGANMASEFLKSATRQAANIVVNRGGKMEWSNVAVDTLGYGIGHSLADQITYNRTEAARQERLREQIKRDLASGLFTNQQATQQELADRLFGAPEDRFAAFGGPGVSLIDIPLSDSGGSTGDAELAELAARLTQSDQRSAEQLAANYRAQEKAGQLIAEAQGPAFLGSTGLDPITAQNLYDARKQFSDQADKFLASLGFLRDSLEYGGHLAKEYLPSSPLYVRQNGSALILPDQPIHPSIFSFSTEPKGAGTTSVKVVDNIAEGTGGFLLGGSKLLRSVPWISGTVGVSLAGYDMYLYEQTGNTDYKASAVNQSAWTAADALVGVGAPFLALTPLGWAGAAVVGIGYGGYRLIDAFNDTQGSFWNAEGYTGDRLKEYFRK